MISAGVTPGLFWGWAQITHDASGAAAFDTDNQALDDEGMVIGAWCEFLASGAPMLEQHSGKQVGAVRFAFPLVPSIAQALGIQTDRYGVIVGCEATDAGTRQRLESGQIRGYSVGGSAKWADVAKMRFTEGTQRQRAVAFKLGELSFVTDPAQEQALIALKKRAGVDVCGMFRKQAETAGAMLDALVKQRRADTGCSMSEALDVVYKSETGRQLYNIHTTATDMSKGAAPVNHSARQEAADKLDELVRAKRRETGQSYVEAFKCVAAEQPALMAAAEG
ncbi:hypothetical protein ACEUAB_13600 [Aeromonas veronii]